MCGRFALIDWTASRSGSYSLMRSSLSCWSDSRKPAGSGGPRYNIAPTQEVLTVTSDGDHNRAEMMRWGLVPSWARDPKIGSRMINARSETLAELPSFRVAFRRRRCLVVADSFYEWRRDGKRRTPMRIGLESGEVFAFAGLWETWRRTDGSALLSCAIVTTEANKLVAPIHDRMPVILDPEAESIWLDRGIEDTSLLSELLTPFPSELMTAYEVSRAVNSATNDGPECIVPAARLL